MLIDTHCHIPNHRYNKTPKELIDEARDEGISHLVNIGTSLEENLEAIKVAEEFEDVYTTIGIHPNSDLDKNLEEIKAGLEEQILTSKKIVGIGECGIDISEDEKQRDIEEQKQLFELQIKLAIKHDLPVVIHNRNGDEIILDILSRNPGVKGVAHCFVSTWETGQKFLDLGFYISFSGVITYKSGQDILETVRNVPLDRFVVETDAPWLSPEENKKREPINEPKYVKITALKVAEARNLPLEEIEEYSFQNSCTLFNLKL